MKEYEVYFEGKIFVGADNEYEATDEACNMLKRSGADFRITSVHDTEVD